MKKVTLMLLLLGAVMVGVTSCGGDGATEGENHSDTTHTEAGH